MTECKAKPLSFSTTIREPRRIPNFLKCILQFENHTLTSTLIHEIVKNIIREKEYIPLYISRSPKLKKIYKNEDETFTDEELEEIILNSPQKHKEANFEYGWDSRFDTWYKMIKEFGFIKYAMNEKITVTKTGHMLVDAYNEQPVNEKKIEKVFLNALMKYQANNPLRKNLTKNAPLPFLLKVLEYFHNDQDIKTKCISRTELPILICWQSNSPDEAYKYIKNVRDTAHSKISDEYIYEKCLNILGTDNRNYIKIEKYVKNLSMNILER